MDKMRKSDLGEDCKYLEGGRWKKRVEMVLNWIDNLNWGLMY